MKRNLIDGNFAAVISLVLICLVLILTPIFLNLIGHSSSSFSLYDGMYGPNGWGTTALRLY